MLYSEASSNQRPSKKDKCRVRTITIIVFAVSLIDIKIIIKLYCEVIVWVVRSNHSLSSNHKKKKKILFVDNEPDITTMLKMALERAGFSIDVFNDPLLALENFKPKLYDLAILDVMMPKMDGN